MQTELTLGSYRICTLEAHRRAVERVIVAMRERLDEPLTLKDMAKIAYISPFHFNRVFHRIAGIPPSQFLYALRLETAKHLLLTTERSVTEVCYEVGYNSLGTFTTRFTQLVGLSPCRLRRLAHHLTKIALPEARDRLITDISNGRFVTGQINAPATFDGAIFVGLFRTRIPQGRPINGTLLQSPGPYCTGPVPDGSYYTFAAAFPRSKDPVDYLLPNTRALLVGVAQSPVVVRNGLARGHANVMLRPMRITDPPILIALPSLLEDEASS